MPNLSNFAGANESFGSAYFHYDLSHKMRSLNIKEDFSGLLLYFRNGEISVVEGLLVLVSEFIH